MTKESIASIYMSILISLYHTQNVQDNFVAGVPRSRKDEKY